MQENNVSIKKTKTLTMRNVLYKKIGLAIMLTIFFIAVLFCIVFDLKCRFWEENTADDLLGLIMCLICGMVVGICLIRIVVRQIMKPIENMDMENPKTDEVYAELKHIAKRMDKQKAFIKEQTITEKEARERMRREFSANVSHELKTPLTSISGYAELMKNGIAKQEDMIRFSEIIYSEATRMITLVNDIIKISKLDEEAEVEWVLEDVDLYEMAMDCRHTLRGMAEKKKVAISVLGEPVVVSGERYLIQEMIHNLTENSIKYNKEKGMVLIKTGEENGKKYIEVSDNGIGIAKEDQSRVFERFYRVDKSHSNTARGTGLGLSIVKHAAIFHNATISLESELKVGTTIKITF